MTAKFHVMTTWTAFYPADEYARAIEDIEYCYRMAHSLGREARFALDELTEFKGMPVYGVRRTYQVTTHPLELCEAIRVRREEQNNYPHRGYFIEYVGDK